MKAVFRYILPLSYVFETRLDSLRVVAATTYMEWLPSVLIIWWFTESPLWKVPLLFVAGWAAFMSFYELGYLMNDLYTVEFDELPRRRTDVEPNPASWVAWIGARLGLFGGLAWYFGWFSVPHWWVLFVVLTPIYLAHNLFQSYEPKVFTFIGLATVRFLAPSAPFLEASEMALLVFPAFLNYVLYRTFSYCDGKELLSMPSRTEPEFRAIFYTLVAGPSLIASVAEASWIPIVFTAYFWVFWVGATVLARLRTRFVGQPAEGS